MIKDANDARVIRDGFVDREVDRILKEVEYIAQRGGNSYAESWAYQMTKAKKYIELVKDRLATKGFVILPEGGWWMINLKF